MQRINYQPLKNLLRDKTTEEKEQFAQYCGTSLGYLKKKMYSGSQFGYQVALKLSDLKIMRPEQLRPNDWQKFRW